VNSLTTLVLRSTLLSDFFGRFSSGASFLCSTFTLLPTPTALRLACFGDMAKAMAAQGCPTIFGPTLMATNQDKNPQRNESHFKFTSECCPGFVQICPHLITETPPGSEKNPPTSNPPEMVCEPNKNYPNATLRKLNTIPQIPPLISPQIPSQHEFPNQSGLCESGGVVRGGGGMIDQRAI
jgi:hypothetical protein